jgi:glyoxylase-like metal-dependent hydrolase (beta-lactamase superfamily II)
MSIRLAAALASASALALAAASAQEQNFDDAVVTAEELGSGIWLLQQPSGGNMGLSLGADGAIMVDDQFAPLAEKIVAKIREVGGDAPRFIINTHHHGDHAGGNEPFAAMGTTLVAQDNVRARLMTEQASPLGGAPTPAAPPAAWPVVTFAQSVTFHMNGQNIHVIHTPPAHTDGDSIVYFEEANVLHAGDLFIRGGYPLIDVAAGGSLGGFVDAQTAAIGEINADTKVIPGHGPLSTLADLTASRDRLAQFRDILAPLAASDLSIEDIIANQPLDGYNDGYTGGLITTEGFIAAAVTAMRRDAAE